jgi:hypothetical protein
MSFFLAPRRSSRFPGVLVVEVDDTWDDSWRHCFTVWFYLTAKHSHVEVDVDGLACSYTVLRHAVVRRGDMDSC